MLLDLKDTILKMIQKYVRDNVNTHLPGQVLSVNDYGNTQTVDVAIQISRLYTDGDVLPNGGRVIYGVPVVMPSAGGGGLTFPVAVGDTVLLVFGQRNMESWKLGDGTAEAIPDDSRHYHESDAIAIPGLYTTRANIAPSTTDVELKFRDGSIKLQPDNTIIVTNGSGSLTMTPGGDINLNGVVIKTDGSITSPGSVTASGDITGAGISLSTHTHLITTGSSAGETAPPTP